MLAIKCALDLFCTASDQKLNTTKSSHCLLEQYSSVRKSYALDILEFLETSTLGKYLSFPMDLSVVHSSSFNFLIDKFKEN